MLNSGRQAPPVVKARARCLRACTLIGCSLALVAAAMPAAAQPASGSDPAADTGVGEQAQPAARPAAVREMGRDLVRYLGVSRTGMSADEAARRAVEAAPEMRGADASVGQSEATVRRQKWGYVPRLSLSASYVRLSPIDLPAGTPASTPKPIVDLYSFGAGLSVPLSDYFFTIAPSVRAAKHNANASKYQRDATRLLVAYQAKVAYYDFTRARARAFIADDSVKLLTGHVKDLTLLASVGEAKQADVLQAEAQVANARVQSQQSHGQMRIAELTLRELLKLGDSYKISLRVGKLDKKLASNKALLATAFKLRPEVRMMNTLVQAQQAQRSAVRGSQLPRLSLSANGDYADPNSRARSQTGGRKFRGSWDLSAVLSWSPNDMVVGGISVTESDFGIAQTRADLAKLKSQMSIDVSQSATDFRVAVQTIDAALVGLTAASEAWRVRKDLLSAGEATPQELLDAESSLRQALNTYVDAHVTANLARARLDYIVGRQITARKTR